MHKLLWGDDISWSDNTNSAWQAMLDQTGLSVTEVKVALRDGSGTMSRLPRNFEEWPNDSFILGNEGGIIFHIVYSGPSGSNEREEYEGVVSKYWGTLVAYAPADQIVRVEIRRVRATNGEWRLFFPQDRGCRRSDFIGRGEQFSFSTGIALECRGVLASGLF